METYDLEPVLGHLVIRVDGRAVLLDTGSPCSYGTVPALTLAGRTWQLRAEPVLMERIGTVFGHRVDVLLGTDVLGAVPLLVDGPGGRVVFGMAVSTGRPVIPLALPCGVPEVTLVHESASAVAFLDTGAPLSYATPDAVAGRAPDGHAEDFHPLVGSFTVPTYQLEVTVGARPFGARFGVLPEQLAPLRQTVGERWILGVEFFRERLLLLDLAGKVAVDMTE